MTWAPPTARRWHAPYRAQWAVARPRSERVILEDHQDGVSAVCAVTVDGQHLLASGSDEARCGSGTPPPASSSPSRRPPELGQRAVRGHRRRPDSCWPAAATMARSGSGTPHRRAAHHSPRPPRRGQRAVRGHRRRPAAAGQRRQRWHGADLGPRHRRAARHLVATRAESARCARSPSTAGSCSPAAATTARCGSGTPPPAISTSPPRRPPELGHGRCARSPSTADTCSPAAATTTR